MLEMARPRCPFGRTGQGRRPYTTSQTRVSTVLNESQNSRPSGSCGIDVYRRHAHRRGNTLFHTPVVRLLDGRRAPRARRLDWWRPPWLAMSFPALRASGRSAGGGLAAENKVVCGSLTTTGWRTSACRLGSRPASKRLRLNMKQLRNRFSNRVALFARSGKLSTRYLIRCRRCGRSSVRDTTNAGPAHP
jgi:hypothetical protein